METSRGVPSLRKQTPFTAKKVVESRGLRGAWLLVTPQCGEYVSDSVLKICIRGELSRKFIHAVFVIVAQSFLIWEISSNHSSAPRNNSVTLPCKTEVTLDHWVKITELHRSERRSRLLSSLFYND